ncbi:MAG: hypothetical protein JWN50_78 [Parcubacteria group bacterium]|nr:hypothetical protein [Parcubacteria group bacterium]
MPKNKRTSGTYWRWLTNVWTALLFLVIMDDFFRGGGLENIIGPVAAVYVAALAIFSAEKEFERWQFYSVGRHPGEVYVFLWTVLVMGMLLTTYATGSSYRMPPEVISTYIAVLAVLAVTRKSKMVFSERSESK